MTRKKFLRWLRVPLHRRAAWKQLALFHAAPRKTVAECVDLALGYESYGHVKIVCHQVRDEIVELTERMAALKPRIVLEIGTYRGGTTLIWSQFASEKVITCDILPMGLRANLMRGFPLPTSKCKVVLMTGDSHDSTFRAEVAAELDGREVDLLFIDGDHSTEGVQADYEMYRDLVRPGGLIAFHDIVESQPIPENQVFGFWKTVRDRPEADEIIGSPDQCGYGIGVLRV